MKSQTWRGQTVVEVGEGGERYRGSHDSAASTPRPTGPRGSERIPSRGEIATQEAIDDKLASKELRSFVSMCVTAWRKGKLTDSHPKAPAALVALVRQGGGNIKWLAASKKRLALFREAANRQDGKVIPIPDYLGGEGE